MTDPGRASKRMTTFIVCVSLALGVAARINSYNANDRLQGDVNLFALTACEFVESGRLFYPFKYDFSSHVTYQQLSDPATQHPPLWPLFAGLSARVFHSHDSFSVLKFLSFLFGVMLLFVLFLLAFKQRGYHLDVCITLVLASFTPLLVDFSANGSPYALMGVLLCSTSLILCQFLKSPNFCATVGGALSGVGMLLHSALIAMPLAFLIFFVLNRKNLRWLHVCWYIFFFAVMFTPYVYWNWVHTGQLLYSYSSFHFLDQLGILEVAVRDGRVTRLVQWPQNIIPVLKRYLALLFTQFRLFPFHLGTELGPFPLFLAGVGFYWTLAIFE